MSHQLNRATIDCGTCRQCSKIDRANLHHCAHVKKSTARGMFDVDLRNNPRRHIKHCKQMYVTTRLTRAAKTGRTWAKTTETSGTLLQSSKKFLSTVKTTADI